MVKFKSAYIKTAHTGALVDKVRIAKRQLRNCHLCPRECGTNRLSESNNVCRTGEKAVVYSYAPHYGEEAPLVGRYGSGTIFFSNCNLRCFFCQNYDISLNGNGHEVSDRELANIMLRLQNLGCHNINFVTPSHVVPQILSALVIAIEDGLTVPLVYNTSAYDNIETLQLLEGIIDIYMPDFKFWDPKVAKKICKAEDYPEVARRALKEMHRQVGDLVTDENGVAQRGLIIRHLVLPNGLAGTREIMHFIANELSANSYVNVMAQYQPFYMASEYKEFARPATRDEYEKALSLAKEAGLRWLDR